MHQLKITLQGARPPLWRRVLVPSDATLGFMHEVIQEAFGWEGFHLHRFEDSRGREWGDPSREDGYFGGGYSDEEDAVLGKVARAEGTVLTYVYDFGDDWYHRIEVEKVLPADPAVSYPVCTGGRRAAPPAEDIGGVWGLHEIASLVAHPEEEVPEHWEDLVRHLREAGWDPAAFDQAELNKALAGFSAPEPASSRKRVATLTEGDLAYCTCGQCQAATRSGARTAATCWKTMMTRTTSRSSASRKRRRPPSSRRPSGPSRSSMPPSASPSGAPPGGR